MYTEPEYDFVEVIPPATAAEDLFEPGVGASINCTIFGNTNAYDNVPDTLLGEGFVRETGCSDCDFHESAYDLETGAVEIVEPRADIGVVVSHVYISWDASAAASVLGDAFEATFEYGSVVEATGTIYYVGYLNDESSDLAAAEAALAGRIRGLDGDYAYVSSVEGIEWTTIEHRNVSGTSDVNAGETFEANLELNYDATSEQYGRTLQPCFELVQ